MKAFIITGAASGLGWATAQELAKRFDGQPVHFGLVDFDREGLAKNAAVLRQGGSEVSEFVADLSSESEVAELVAGLQEAFPSVDLLVNNAGITHRSVSTQTSNAVIRRVMAVDYHAPVELAQGLHAALAAAGGTVINISSMAGWMPVLGRAGYCAAKSALHQYFETFREEVREDGIKLLMVYPSFVRTNIEANALSGDGGRAKHKQSTLGKVQTPQWMANRIINAWFAGKERLFPTDKTLLGAWLYRLWPKLFMKQMVRNFQVELDVARANREAFGSEAAKG